ncbi:MAG: heavy metal sensor histidine kinase [Planctomycetes bacterium]|nr:heavy metal sensor histidine kinase [Planctomycetota bacterium]
MSSPPRKPAFYRRARFRLTLYYTAIQLLFLVLLAVFVHMRSSRSMLTELEKFIRDDTSDLMAFVLDLKDNWVEIQKRLDFESSGERYYELSFRLLDTQGNVKALSRAFREAVPATGPIDPVVLHDVVVEGESRQEIVPFPNRPCDYLLVTRPWSDPQTKQVRYVVQTLAYLEPLEKLSRRFRKNLISVIPLFVLISWFAGHALARKVLKPIGQISRTARQITSSSLNERLVRSKTGDEFDLLADTLNDMIGRLEESFTLTRKFAADAAHELRTPLTILKGEAEVALRSKDRDPAMYEEVLESNIREYDRMIHIITQLLLLAQADAGKVVVGREPVRLDLLLGELAETFHVLADSAQLTLEAGPFPEVVVNGDRARLHELFANLLDNAVKYTPPGGRVSVTCTTDAEHVSVAVADTGIGISPDDQTKVFGRFYRVEGSRSRNTGGAGLGLSISRWIATAHGGRIELQSTLGAGSTFTVVLPLPVGTDSQVATEPANGQAPPGTEDRGQRTEDRGQKTDDR